MGKSFKTTEEMYEVFGKLLGLGQHDDVIGKKLAKANITIRFKYTDPEGAIFIDLKSPPEEGHFNYSLGDYDTKSQITFTQSADFSNRFWQGKENPLLAIPARKIKAEGNFPLALKLLPAIRPLFRAYKKMLKDIGREDLIA